MLLWLSVGQFVSLSGVLVSLLLLDGTGCWTWVLPSRVHIWLFYKNLICLYIFSLKLFSISGYHVTPYLPGNSVSGIVVPMLLVPQVYPLSDDDYLIHFLGYQKYDKGRLIIIIIYILYKRQPHVLIGDVSADIVRYLGTRLNWVERPLRRSQ